MMPCDCQRSIGRSRICVFRALRRIGSLAIGREAKCAEESGFQAFKDAVVLGEEVCLLWLGAGN